MTMLNHGNMLYFNPRSHERSDGIPDSTIYDWGKFQSTLPREERPCLLVRYYNVSYFNPRSHERSDTEAFIKAERDLKISIHAPTRGATIG